MVQSCSQRGVYSGSVLNANSLANECKLIEIIVQVRRGKLILSLIQSPNCLVVYLFQAQQDLALDSRLV